MGRTWTAGLNYSRGYRTIDGFDGLYFTDAINANVNGLVTRRLSFVLSGAQLGITVTSLVVGFIAEPVFRDALAPLFMLASAAQGFLRGMGDLRTPLLILVAAHTLNVFLEVLFVYGFGWGLAGSAWGTVLAQVGMAGAFFAVQWRAGLERPRSGCAGIRDR